MTDTPQVQIRVYEARDRAGLDACIRELQEHEREIEPRMKPADDIVATYADGLLDRCAETKGAILVAMRGRSVIGYACVYARVANEDDDEIDYDYAYVADIAVNATERGRGVGKRLLAAAEKHARSAGAKCLRITVLAANTGALTLYRQSGFEPRIIELEKALA